jgi:NADH-quinone oxidoreductase subunit N
MLGILPSLKGIAPELMLAAGAVFLLVWDLFFRRTTRFCVNYGLALALAALYVIAFAIPSPGGVVFSGQFSTDGITMAARLVTLGVLVVVLLLSGPYLAVKPVPPAEYTALLLFASAGLQGVAASRNWIVLFIFLEMATISIAALLGLRRSSRENREATLKYFILSVSHDGNFHHRAPDQPRCGRAARPVPDPGRPGLQVRSGTVPHVGA